MKPPTTFEEQLAILKRRNLIVEDDVFAKKAKLLSVYGISLPFKLEAAGM